MQQFLRCSKIVKSNLAEEKTTRTQCKTSFHFKSDARHRGKISSYQLRQGCNFSPERFWRVLFKFDEAAVKTMNPGWRGRTTLVMTRRDKSRRFMSRSAIVWRTYSLAFLSSLSIKIISRTVVTMFRTSRQLSLRTVSIPYRTHA